MTFQSNFTGNFKSTTNLNAYLQLAHISAVIDS